jgi:hypothetical protein
MFRMLEAGEACLPDAPAGRRYYLPRDAGLEARIRKRLARLRGEPEPEADGPGGEGEGGRPS